MLPGEGSGRHRLALERGEGEDHDLGNEDPDLVEKPTVDGQRRFVVLQAALEPNRPRHHAAASSSRSVCAAGVVLDGPRSICRAGPAPAATGSQ